MAYPYQTYLPSQGMQQMPYQQPMMQQPMPQQPPAPIVPVSYTHLDVYKRQANTQRQFDVYDDFLLKGDGEYRISLYAQGEDGSWNDNYYYIPQDSSDVYKRQR